MNWKKIGLFLLFTFGISWTVALAMKLAHLPYGGLISILLTATLYMPGPAIATFVIQRFIYKEGFASYGWQIDKKDAKWLFLTPVLFLALFFLSFAVIGLLGNTHLVNSFGQLDFSMENFRAQLGTILSSRNVSIDAVKLPPIPPWLYFVALLFQGIIGGATINVPFMLGEELGWRGLLFHETRSIGFFRANLFIGLVWGIWHSPIILMGHNYPHHPYFGIIMMCLFTTALAPLFAYIRIKTKTILGPCILHGVINATPAMFTLFVSNGNELYSSIAGWAGIIACVLITAGIYMWDREAVESYRSAVQGT